jgi:hypothetical protein
MDSLFEGTMDIKVDIEMLPPGFKDRVPNQKPAIA